ncbi:MAG: hypothetical protein JW725_01665 [Candidatus Babeliaceae bacterium]|nr:hypothetical protein [Candidatus Babeliaceae bacterium]
MRIYLFALPVLLILHATSVQSMNNQSKPFIPMFYQLQKNKKIKDLAKNFSNAADEKLLETFCFLLEMQLLSKKFLAPIKKCPIRTFLTIIGPQRAANMLKHLVHWEENTLSITGSFFLTIEPLIAQKIINWLQNEERRFQFCLQPIMTEQNTSLFAFLMESKRYCIVQKLIRYFDKLSLEKRLTLLRTTDSNNENILHRFFQQQIRESSSQFTKPGDVSTIRQILSDPIGFPSLLASAHDWLVAAAIQNSKGDTILHLFANHGISFLRILSYNLIDMLEKENKKTSTKHSKKTHLFHMFWQLLQTKNNDHQTPFEIAALKDRQNTFNLFLDIQKRLTLTGLISPLHPHLFVSSCANTKADILLKFSKI